MAYIYYLFLGCHRQICLDSLHWLRFHNISDSSRRFAGRDAIVETAALWGNLDAIFLRLRHLRLFLQEETENEEWNHRQLK